MNSIVELHFVPTEQQLADIFTKPLDESTFNRLVSELGMLNFVQLIGSQKMQVVSNKFDKSINLNP